MTLSSRDIERALDVLDGLSDGQVQVLRRMIAEVEARLLAYRTAGISAEPPAPVLTWDAVAAALMFVIWSTNEASLGRSLAP